jgi:virulence-associated protein VagC
MSVERQVKLFCKGTVALMHCEEDRLIIEPLRRRGLLATLAKLPTLEEEFPGVDRGTWAIMKLSRASERIRGGGAPAMTCGLAPSVLPVKAGIQKNTSLKHVRDPSGGVRNEPRPGMLGRNR